MSDWEHPIGAVGSVRIIWVLGGLFVTSGAIEVGFLLMGGGSLGGAVIDFIVLGGPGLGLWYGAYRLPRTSVDPAAYPRVVRWSLGGLALMLGVVGLLTINPSGSVDRPLRAAVIAAGFGAVGGFPIGLNDARAITRAREAEQRNRELKRAQAELQKTVDRLEESNERLEQFAYAASHDLQEPLRMVSSYLRLLENRYDDALDGDALEFIEFAVDGADRMREMIDGLLVYSRIETQGDQFEPVDLETVFEAVLDDLQVQIEERDTEITADSLPRVEGDENQLRQVFQNLLSNAIEYSGDEPPRVHVSSDRDGVLPNGVSEDSSGEQSESDDAGWTISVSDEGIGIDPDDSDRIFQVFQRLHTRDEHDGPGIGLALCERIVERHGGDIWVEPEPGEGATFSFTLPPVDQERESHSTTQSTPVRE